MQKHARTLTPAQAAALGKPSWSLAWFTRSTESSPPAREAITKTGLTVREYWVLKHAIQDATTYVMSGATNGSVPADLNPLAVKVVRENRPAVERQMKRALEILSKSSQ
jgi:hypothetical protein